MKGIAMNTVIEARGKLMREYKDERISEWDVDGDIKLWEDLLASSPPQTEAIEREGEDDDLGVDRSSIRAPDCSNRLSEVSVTLPDRFCPATAVATCPATAVELLYGRSAPAWFACLAYGRSALL
ncbi:hypothetical protein Dimus_008699 [Dionaea muscipula]